MPCAVQKERTHDQKVDCYSVLFHPEEKEPLLSLAFIKHYTLDTVDVLLQGRGTVSEPRRWLQKRKRKNPPDGFMAHISTWLCRLSDTHETLFIIPSPSCGFPHLKLKRPSEKTVHPAKAAFQDNEMGGWPFQA